MTDMQTPRVNPGTQPLITPAFHEAVAGRLKESIQALEPAASSGDPALRARLAEIGARAQKLQVTAGAAWQATEALSNMGQALSFALDTAREARDARSLPEAALAQMQKHVDLAINTVDGLAAEATSRRRSRGGFKGARRSAPLFDEATPEPLSVLRGSGSRSARYLSLSGDTLRRVSPKPPSGAAGE